MADPVLLFSYNIWFSYSFSSHKYNLQNIKLLPKKINKWMYRKNFWLREDFSSLPTLSHKNHFLWNPISLAQILHLNCLNHCLLSLLVWLIPTHLFSCSCTESGQVWRSTNFWSSLTSSGEEARGNQTEAHLRNKTEQYWTVRSPMKEKGSRHSLPPLRKSDSILLSEKD